MKDKAGSPQDYNEHDICEGIIFPMPDMIPRGLGGRGCGRGRGPGLGGLGMGRGGRKCGRGPHGRPDPRQMPPEHWNQGAGVFGGPHGRPDSRQMPFGHCNNGYGVFGGPHGRPDPRQMPFGHWNNGYGVFGGPHVRPDPRQMAFGHWNKGYGVFEGPHGRPDPRQMPFIHGSHLHRGFGVTQAREDTNKENMEGSIKEHFSFGPALINRPPLMRRLRRLVSQMENTNQNSSGSDTDNSQDAANEERNCDSERRNFPRKECHRSWRRFMHRQPCKCPRRPAYGYGPPQAWQPPCAPPMVGGPPPCCPMVPPQMLRRLHRLLTALESEMNKETKAEKDEDKKTANQESNHEEPTPRHARLQARLRRLIAHTKQQLAENAQFLPPHPWMMRMQTGPRCWDVPCNMRRLRKHKIRTQACKTDATNASNPDKETKEAEDATEEEDIAMATSGRDALSDWEDLLQDVDDIQDEQEDVAPEDPSELCQTCGCSIPV